MRCRALLVRAGRLARIWRKTERGLAQSESLRREGQTSLQPFKADGPAIDMQIGAAQAAEMDFLDFCGGFLYHITYFKEVPDIWVNI